MKLYITFNYKVKNMAEREGFEPSKDVYALTPLAGERFRPLSHLSKWI